MCNALSPFLCPVNILKETKGKDQHSFQWSKDILEIKEEILENGFVSVFQLTVTDGMCESFSVSEIQVQRRKVKHRLGFSPEKQ